MRNIDRGEIVTNVPRAKSLFLILVLCAVRSIPVFAQMATATLSGVISDPGGGVVPDVEVTVTRIETGTVFATKTNGAGIYFFTGLMPGHYHLMIHKPGFKEIAIKEFELHVQDKLEQNFSLEIGSVSETVTVTANDLNINTTDGSVSTVIDRNFVESLPLNGRSFNTLLQLTPGVVIAPGNPQPNQAGQFSVAGQRTSANNFVIDGVSANFGVSSTAFLGTSGTGAAQAFSALGGTSSLVSVEALQEFRIETSSFAPEFGRSPGGQVSLTTRSGTNQFHGGIYEYFRNDVLDANNWFADQAGLGRAAERHNDFGGFWGGRIKTDNTFFFLSYEGARLRQPNATNIQVPSEFARTSAPSPIAPFLLAYPQPNDRTITPGVYIETFTGNYSNPSTLNAGSIRIDHVFNDKLSIFGRYNEAPSAAVSRGQGNSEVDTTTVGTRTLTIGATMVLSPQVSNALRGNYSLQNSSLESSLDTLGGAVPPSLSVLAPNVPNAASSEVGFLLFDLFPGGFYQTGPVARNRSTQLNFADDLAVTRGAHQLKFGADYRAIFLDVKLPAALLVYQVSSIPTFLATSQADFGVEGVTQNPSHFLVQSTSLYAQDTWKITARLALTYGLRWELSPAPSAREGTTLAAWTNVNNPAATALAPSGTPLWRTTYTNFAPRVGMAYSLTPSGDFVLRAGGGIFYDLGSDTAASLASTFPNSAASFSPPVTLPLSDATPFLPAISLQPPFPSFGTNGFTPNLKLPRSYQWNLALEKSFSGQQAVSITYVGQAGRDLLRQEGINQPNVNFLGPFLLTLNDARSNYNALQVQYRRPISSHFQALLNYQWSHSLDNASNDSESTVSHTIISAGNDYASSDFDVRQSFSGALSYEIPSSNKTELLGRLTKDWSIDTVIVARSGFPFNASIVTNPLAGTNPRPDLVLGQPLYLFGAQCSLAFGPEGNGVLLAGQTCPGGKGLNPDAFSIPSTIRQGTEGRNDIPGFGLTQVDLSIERKFAITERINLKFRTDAFNLLNHPNFANPSAEVDNGNGQLLSTSMLNKGLGGLNPLFQEGGPRSLQLSLKLSF
jgi:carboxypeptidase family protein/TonB-dependent receptor-like protein